MSIDAMKQALEALERGETQLRYAAITALRAAIEQAERLRQWQGLTEEEVKRCYFGSRADFMDYARAIEAKLRERNT